MVNKNIKTIKIKMFIVVSSFYSFFFIWIFWKLICVPFHNTGQNNDHVQMKQIEKTLIPVCFIYIVLGEGAVLFSLTEKQ